MHPDPRVVARTDDHPTHATVGVVELFKEAGNDFHVLAVILHVATVRPRPERVRFVVKQVRRGPIDRHREACAHRLQHVAEMTPGLPFRVAGTFRMNSRLACHRPSQLGFARARRTRDQNAAMDRLPRQLSGLPRAQSPRRLS